VRAQSVISQGVSGMRVNAIIRIDHYNGMRGKQSEMFTAPNSEKILPIMAKHRIQTSVQIGCGVIELQVRRLRL